VRLFLDTNVLLPNGPGEISVKLENVLNAARDLLIEIELPQVVEIELKRQMQEKIQAALVASADHGSNIIRWCGTPEPTLTIPAKETALSSYEATHQGFITKWNIRTTPTSQSSLLEVLFWQTSEN
jgi:hypothetical protein